MLNCVIFTTLLTVVIAILAFNFGKTSREPTKVSSLISHPVVDLDMEVIGGSKKSNYHCSCNFQLGDNGKSLSFAGLDDTSIFVQAIGRRTAALRIVTGHKSIDIEVTAAESEVNLDENRRIKLAFLSSTLPPYDELIHLSENITVFRHYHVEPIKGGKVVPANSTEESVRSNLLKLLRKMLTEPHGTAGFDSRGQGYEIDLYVDGQPVHMELTFRSGWIVVKDAQSTRQYGFHPDCLRDLHVALDQYLTVTGFDSGVGSK